MTASLGPESPDLNTNLAPDDGSPGPTMPTEEVVGQEDESRRRKVILLLLLLLGFALLLGLAIWYLLFRQPIPIPSIPGETVMPTYATAIYGVDRPLGVAVNEDGSRIYIGETGGDRIARVFDANGQQLAEMQPPVSTGVNHVPVYLALHPTTGEVYVTDRPTGSIYIYDANGTYQRTLAVPVSLKGWQPLGLAFDTSGNLYVTDVSAAPQVVQVLDGNGTLIRTLGESAGMSFPNGVAVDAAGNAYVTDSNNGRLLVFDPSGALVAQVGRGVGQGNLGLPRGVAVGGDGRVYIADATGQGVFVYAGYQPSQSALGFLGFFGGEGVSNGTFRYPNGLALDARGRIYVTDSGNARVQVWTY